MRKALIATAAFALAASPLPALAKVHQADANGFVVRHAVEVPAAPSDAFAELLHPERWWNGAHSYSADAANFSLDPRAGGCFCEVLPNPDSPRAAPRGTVEHMRVVYIEQDRVLRLSGGLGPLQSEALIGTLTVVLKPAGEGRTQILWEYVVGGYMRMETAKIAPAVDAVIGEQLQRLAKNLGAADGGAADGQAAPEAAPAVEQDETPEPVAEAEGDAFSESFDDILESEAEPAKKPVPGPTITLPPRETYGPADPETGR
jgi:hypothetical protein